MATEKWIQSLGVWTQAGFTEINSLPNGSAVQLLATINNGTNLDMFMDIGVNLPSVAWIAPARLDFYIVPLNSDGTTYGDGRFASQAAASPPPPANYSCGSIGLNPTTTAGVGTLTGIVIIPFTFKIVVMNNGGIAFASTGNAIFYRTYNRQVT